MSEILTGPDRGPPKFDWRTKAVNLERENERMAEALVALHRIGGLGFPAHKLIAEGLGVPYPGHCIDPTECRNRSSCPRNHSCIE